ncbi:MAG: VCBS repeat-containing protein [Euryarchaeota archaeon]|nr:VCBS repeat-containing protein [Euryarchaeota archaeon]
MSLVLLLTLASAPAVSAEEGAFVLARDVIDDSGIGFTQAPNRLGPPEPDIEPPVYQVFQETTTGGACWGDYDVDGRLDLFVTDSYGPEDEGHGRLYRNLGREADGVVRFADVTEAQGVLVKGIGQGCVWGDYDNDGWPDLFLTFSAVDYALQTNVLFHNKGDGTGFEDVSETAGVSGDADDRDSDWSCNAKIKTDDGFLNKCWSMSAAWIDYDLDGDLDLYVGNYVDESGSACTENPFPNPILCNGQPNRMYRNDGGHRFTEVGGLLQVDTNREATFGRSLGVVATDIDGDTLPDIYVANDFDANGLYLRNRIGNFRNVGSALEVDGLGEKLRGTTLYGHRAGMGIDAADYNNDGAVDLVTTHLRAQYDAVYLASEPGAWHDVGNRSATLREIAWSISRWGGGFVDLDRDGWKDYLAVSGHQFSSRPGPVSLAINRMGEAGVPRTAEEVLVSDEDTWRLATAPYWPFGNDSVESWHNHRGAAFADYDDDGDMDLFVTALESHKAGLGRPKLLRFDALGAEPEVDHPDNPARDSRWLRVTLEGTDNARDAIGAKVQVITGDGSSQWQWRSSGASYGGNNDPRLLFALGGETRGEVVVTWPGKPDAPQTLPFDLGSDKGRTLHIVEVESAPPARPEWRGEPVSESDALRLSWSMNQAVDFAHHKVYATKDTRFDTTDARSFVFEGPSGGGRLKGLEGGEWYLWLVAVDQAGRESEPSERMAVVMPESGLLPAPGAVVTLLILVALIIGVRGRAGRRV